MTIWTETYRGAVPPWQCDVTEHFTIAYYFDRVEEAEANLADELGLGDLSRRGDLPRRLDARFVRELRAGSSFHVESAALSVDHGLRIGHRFVDSANGEAVMSLLRELHAAGSTICMVTHDPRYANFADRQVRLFDGRVVEEENIEAAKN